MGLVATDFENLEDLRMVIDINYYSEGEIHCVDLNHHSNGECASAVLCDGTDEEQLKKAAKDVWKEKLAVGKNEPNAVRFRTQLKEIYILSRRRRDIFGEDDVAFFDIALAMLRHIDTNQKAALTPAELCEKGYLNSFNHITSQAFMTTLYGMEVARFVANTHERLNMPELTSGNFRPEQLSNPENNPMDNYVDMINNAWGQRLGSELKRRYDISDSTKWSEALLTRYLNSVQQYYTYAFGLSFRPFVVDEYLIKKFSRKINAVKSLPTEEVIAAD
ncbi:MAG: hypothetical protein Kow0075_06660 [Salibacteraceae bacterium]